MSQQRFNVLSDIMKHSVDGDFMKVSRKYSTVLFAVFMTLAMSFSMAFTMTAIMTGFTSGFFERFLGGFVIGFVVGVPTSLLVIPIVRRIVDKMTVEET